MELLPLLTEDPDVVQWDEDLVEGFLSEVTEAATGILYLSNQVKEFKEMMEGSVRKQTLELQEREKDSDLRQSLEAELLTLVLEMQTKEVVAQVEEQKREVEVRTEKVVEREKVVSLLDERFNELEKREEEIRVIQDAEAKDVEVKRKELEAREKEIEVKMRSLEVKEKELEEREELLKGKGKEFDERSENRKRSRDESETSLFAENDRDEDNPPLIHTAKRHKPTREHNSLDCDCNDLASASASEVYEVVECIDDEEDPEPYNCLDADFNNFNNTISSFSVGQVWALYDPFDHMPRFYAESSSDMA